MSVLDYLLPSTYQQDVASIFKPKLGTGVMPYDVSEEDFRLGDIAYDNFLSLLGAGYQADPGLLEAAQTAETGYERRWLGDLYQRDDKGRIKFATGAGDWIDPDSLNDYGYLQVLRQAGTAPMVETESYDRPIEYTQTSHTTPPPVFAPSNPTDEEAIKYFQDKAKQEELRGRQDEMYYIPGGFEGDIETYGDGKYVDKDPLEQLFGVAEGDEIAPEFQDYFEFTPEITPEGAPPINIFDPNSLLYGLQRAGVEDATPGMVKAAGLSDLRALDPGAYMSEVESTRRPLSQALALSLHKAREQGSGFAGYGKRAAGEAELRRQFGEKVGGIYSGIDRQRGAALSKLYDLLGTYRGQIEPMNQGG